MLVIIVFGLVLHAEALKIILYQPAFGHSHMQFSGKLVDILADAGHEVHMLIPEWNPETTSDGTTRAVSSRRIKSSSHGVVFTQLDHIRDPYRMTVWRYLLKRDQLRAIVDISGEFCRLMVNDKDLIVWLRNEKFDAALASIYDMCASGLFHVANIKPVMGFIPTPASSIIFSMFGISTPSSYTQDSLFPTGSGDVMNYWQRAKNLAIQYLLEYVTTPYVERMQHQVFTDKFGPSFPSLRSLLINFSYVFINSNELFELPRPLSHKMIYVGGIALPKQKRLPEVYLKLFSEYPSAVLFSFGSLARTTLMPIEMKSAFIDAFAKFPHILFIWKVDRGTANDSFYTKAPNVFTVEWTPQNDLLRSGHIDAFITHAGLNSLSEAIFAGVPVISIPLFGDQLYNAEIAKKRHIGYVISKWNVTVNNIVDAIKTILYDKSYSIKSKELSLMLEKKPMKPSEMFLKYVEFAAEFKSVGEYLQLQSVNLNDIQLYSLDVIVPFLFCLLLFYYLSFLIAMRLFRCLRASFKTKRD